MSFAEIDQALIKAVYAGAFDLPVALENVPYSSENGAPYIAVFNLPAPVIESTLGAGGCELHSGLLQLNLNYPQDTGTTAIKTKANVIRVWFKNGATFTAGGISARIKNTSIAQIIVDGGWCTLPVTVEYYAHTTRS